MLKVRYNISQILGDCNCFYFEDSTPSYSEYNKCGYGVPNVKKEDILKTEIFITFSNGDKYKIDRHYLPTRLPIKICTSDFVPINEVFPTYTNTSDCGCGSTAPPVPLNNCLKIETVQDCGQKTSILQLRDGCVTIEYYVWAMQAVKRSCDYKITGINLQEGQLLWAEVNGALVNISQNIHDGVVVFSETSDIYNKYYIKNGDIIEYCGEFIQENCTYIPLATPEEAIVSYKISNEVFICNTEYALSEIIYKHDVVNNSSCDKEHDAITQMLALSIAKLTGIKNNPSCNCRCIEDTLLQINTIIKRINDIC